MNNYLVEGEEVSITELDWDYLVILDACRYDLFRQMYSCKKAISSETWTLGFLNTTFPLLYSDIVYVSANPFVNSGMKVRHKEKYTFNHYLSYDAKQHFYKVIDVWKHGWKNGTVHPSYVNKYFHRSLLRYKGKRFVLHYIQPHQPFLSLINTTVNDNVPKKNLYQYIPVWKHLSPPLRWEIKKLLHLPSEDVLEIGYRRYGCDFLRQLHKRDIEIVMGYVQQLMDSISGKFIITADHGDRLCSLLRYEHGGPHDKEVVTVPWMEIEN